MEFLVACGETPFRFDPAALRASAAGRWPQAQITEPGPLTADIVDCDIYVEDQDDNSQSEIAVHRSGEGIGFDSRTVAGAADVLAWLAGVPGLPDDGSVVVVHWQDDVYPLRPGRTIEELLADYQL